MLQFFRRRRTRLAGRFAAFEMAGKTAAIDHSAISPGAKVVLFLELEI